MLLQEIIRHLEDTAPVQYQESYDNSGLILGDRNREIHSALVTLDVTEEVMKEAIDGRHDLIICHHPLIFKGIKSITGATEVERCLITAIKNDVAIYAAHTNLDSVPGGVNSKICEKIGLKNCRILLPLKNQLVKLVTFVPGSHLEVVRNAVFAAGAGVIGNYDSCSYQSAGHGTFRGNEETHPFAGRKGELHTEPEIRFETILPRHLTSRTVKALLETHPYEEVAYDLLPLENDYPMAGAGMLGELEEPCDGESLLLRIKDLFHCGIIRHTAFTGRKIRKVAVCGGAGSFLLSRAMAEGADLYLSADFKYHDFFGAENKILVADIGHYESEQFTKEVLKEIVLKKFPTFALRLSEVQTNPVFYL